MYMGYVLGVHCRQEGSRVTVLPLRLSNILACSSSTSCQWREGEEEEEEEEEEEGRAGKAHTRQVIHYDLVLYLGAM